MMDLIQVDWMLMKKIDESALTFVDLWYRMRGFRKGEERSIDWLGERLGYEMGKLELLEELRREIGLCIYNIHEAVVRADVEGHLGEDFGRFLEIYSELN